MTHDVIRDLLSVKLDISNYAVSSGLGILEVCKKNWFSLSLIFLFFLVPAEYHRAGSIAKSD